MELNEIPQFWSPFLYQFIGQNKYRKDSTEVYLTHVGVLVEIHTLRKYITSSNIKVTKATFENVAEFKYWGTTVKIKMTFINKLRDIKFEKCFLPCMSIISVPVCYLRK